MSIKRWRPEITIKFIEEYAKYRNLWDPTHQEYKKAEMRVFSLKQIATSMASYGIKLDVAATKVKIRIIRNTYINELRKMAASKRSGTGKYRTNLYWFRAADNFLRDVIKLPDEVRKYCEDSEDGGSVTKELASNEAVIEFLKIEEQPSAGIIEEKTEIADYHLPPASIPENDRTPGFSLEKHSESSLSASRTKVKQFRPNSEQHTDVISSYAGLHSSTSYSGEDEFELFGRSIASQMRQLPLVYALELEAEIQNLIVQKRLKVLRKATEKATPEANSTISCKRPVLYTIDIPERAGMSFQAVDDGNDNDDSQ